MPCLRQQLLSLPPRQLHGPLSSYSPQGPLRAPKPCSMAFPTRDGIGALVEALLERLDCLDGDPDIEEDDPAGVRDEDGINTCTGYDRRLGPGCPISDPGGCEHDGRELV